MRFSSIGASDDFYHIARINRPLDFINLVFTMPFHPSLENWLKQDLNLRLKVIWLCDDLLNGAEMLADDDLMTIGGLGDAVDVELISAEEILD